MGYTFCFYENTEVIHIFREIQNNLLLKLVRFTLCGRSLNKENCKKLGIYVDGSPYKPFKNLSEDEARSLAQSLQALGVNICADCVRELYKND